MRELTGVEGHASLGEHSTRTAHWLAVWAHGEVGGLLHAHGGRRGVEGGALHGRDHAALLLLLLEGDGQHLPALRSHLGEGDVHGFAHEHLVIHLLDAGTGFLGGGVADEAEALAGARGLGGWVGGWVNGLARDLNLS